MPKPPPSKPVQAKKRLEKALTDAVRGPQKEPLTAEQVEKARNGGFA